MTLAHPDQPIAPHDLWSAWNLDPLIVLGLLVAAWVFRTGHARGRGSAGDRRRARYFAGALTALAVALISPLDALSGALASAHMVQHLLLIVVVAPLLTLSASATTLVRGTPAPVRRRLALWRGRLGLTRARTGVVRHPATLWLLHVGTLWFWHAAGPYGAALDHETVHVLEHATFLATGVLFWNVVAASRRPGGMSPGFGVMLLFAMAMQGVFLSALLTFARTPWYDGYAETTRAWGLEPLADQQLAGVIMWIPGGALYVIVALRLLAGWIRDSEQAAPDVKPLNERPAGPAPAPTIASAPDQPVPTPRPGR
jgi:cytochrome c oxidase assembly factor CtaG